jgi:hypothetical protein
MERTILDATDEKENGRYARRSFWLFLLGWISYLPVIAFSIFVLGQISPTDIDMLEIVAPIIRFLSYVGFTFSIFGLYYAVKSFRSKEERSIKRYISLIGNLVLASILTISIIFYLIVEYY